MMKLLLWPFRAVLFTLAVVFFPFYLLWVFRLHWMVYFGLALGVGWLAYQDYETYRFNLLEAELQIADGATAAIPLSKWRAADNTPYNDEVTIRGLYLTAIATGEFDPVGLNRQFILLADDQGREVKGVLVVWLDDLARLQRQLDAQGSGDRILVTVNGSLNTNTEWARLIEAELMVMNVPRAQDIVVVEPFIGDRATAITKRAEKTFGTVAIFGGVAGLLALLGVAKRLSSARAQPAKRAQTIKRNAAHPEPVAAPQASPWGTFTPITPAPRPALATKAAPKAGHPMPPRTPQNDGPPPQPEFKSVFPGGGSSFRFKSADEIILQSFGTVSKLKPTNRHK